MASFMRSASEGPPSSCCRSAGSRARELNGCVSADLGSDGGAFGSAGAAVEGVEFWIPHLRSSLREGSMVVVVLGKLCAWSCSG